MANLSLSIGTASFAGPKALKPALDFIKALGIKEIDTAQIYGNNEADLGATGAAAIGFTISTKNPGGWKRGTALEPSSLLTTTRESLQRLNTPQVDIFYIHGPDRTLAPAVWLPVINTLHTQGAFRRFGLSNFSPQEVRDVHGYCRTHNLVLPSVYQGNYNAFSRIIETTLFPVLRELGIAFYAYSPTAGGFLTKSRAALEDGTAGGRFASGDNALAVMYRGLYLKPTMLDGLDRWEALAAEQGVSNAELAYRWLYYHSALRTTEGDVVIVGASKIAQIEETVEGLNRGALKDEVAKGIDEIWAGIKHEAIVDNFDASNGQLPEMSAFLPAEK